MSYKAVVGVPGPPGTTAVNDDDTEALGTHSVSATAPLTGGGTLASNPSLGITQATAGTDGFVTQAKFNAWDDKMDNPMTAFGDLIYGGAGVPPVPTPLAVGAAGTVLKGDGATPQWGTLSEADLTLNAVATNNATTVRHGFLPQLSNVAAQYLDGQGTWTVPAGGAGAVPPGYVEVNYNHPAGGATNVIHNFGCRPIVAVLDAGNNLLAMPSGTISLVHNTANDFTVTFVGAASGKILASVGAPQLQNVVVTAADYVATIANHIIQVSAAGKSVTLPTVAAAGTGREFVVDNSSNGDVTVLPNGAELIEGEVNQIVPPQCAIRIYCNGVAWRIY